MATKTISFDDKIDRIIANHYDKLLAERLGDTVRWYWYRTPIATEVSKEVEMLPKDLLSELEKLDEKRVNEHLKRTDGSMGQDYGRSVGLDLNDIARMQRMHGDLINSQMQSRQMFASSQFISQPRPGFGPNW